MTVSWITFIFVLLPFFYFHKVSKVIEVILKAVGEYPYLSMNAYNLWWLVSWGKARWVSDTHFFLNLFTYRTLGTILLGIFIILLLKYLFKREKDEQAVFLSCALAIFAFFMLPTEMHERYIVPVFAFLLLAVVKSNSLKIIYGTLSIAAFFNLFLSVLRTYPKNFPLSAPFWQAFPADIIVSVVNVAILIYFLFLLLKDVKINYKHAAYFGGAGLILLGGLYFLKSQAPVYLSDLESKSSYQEWGKLQKDRSVDGNRLTVNGFKYSKGLGTHAYSSITYLLDGRFRFLEGAVGLDDEQRRGNKIEFLIYADKRLIYKSGILGGRQNPRHFYLPVSGVKELSLVVGNGGDGINCDHADWLGIRVLP